MGHLFRTSLLLLVAGTVGITTAVSPASAALPTSLGCVRTDIGIAGGAPLLSLPDAELDRELTAIRDAGATWLRFDVDWSTVEPIRGQQNWAMTDRLVDRAKSRGLNLVGIITYTPPWARVPGVPADDSHGYPADVAAYGTFARQTAQRYANRVSTWEIWNEPNLVNFFRPAPNVDKYVQMLQAASQGIRSVQPGATILNGGLAPAVDVFPNISPVTYTAELYARGAQQYFNVLSVHPYSWPALPSDASTQGWNTFYRMRFMRETMVRHGDSNKKIWATEFGAPTGIGPVAVSRQHQANIIADGIAEARRLGFVERVFIYSMRDRGRNLRDIEQNFGLVTLSFTAKPSLAVVKKAATSCP